jgi:hypothetical protein
MSVGDLLALVQACKTLSVALSVCIFIVQPIPLYFVSS